MPTAGVGCGQRAAGADSQGAAPRYTSHLAVSKAGSAPFPRPRGLRLQSAPACTWPAACGAQRLITGRGLGLAGAPPHPGPVNWRPLRWRPLRCAAVWGGGVRAAAAMATVREKAAALNLTAFQSPAQRPPSRCRGPGLGTLGVTGRAGGAGWGSRAGGGSRQVQPGPRPPPRAPHSCGRSGRRPRRWAAVPDPGALAASFLLSYPDFNFTAR